MSQNTPDYAIVDLRAAQEIVQRAPCSLTLAVYVMVRGRTHNPRRGWRMTVAGLAADVGCSKRSVQRALGWLEEEGFLTRRRRGMAPGKRMVSAGLGARELESDYYAPQQPLPHAERTCLPPPTSLGAGTDRCAADERASGRADARTHGRTVERKLRRVRRRTCTVVERSCVRAFVRPRVCDQAEAIALCAASAAEECALVSAAAQPVEKRTQTGTGEADPDPPGVTGESPLPQGIQEEEFPSVVSPSPEQTLEKEVIYSPSPTPIAATPSAKKPPTVSATAVDLGEDAPLELEDFGVGTASTLASRCRSRCRRRAVTVEMVDLLTEATLAAEETDPHSGWLYRCREPDERLVTTARDLLREQRRQGSYGGTLCKRTISRGLKRVWRLCDHLPAARAGGGPARLGART